MRQIGHSGGRPIIYSTYHISWPSQTLDAIVSVILRQRFVNGETITDVDIAEAKKEMLRRFPEVDNLPLSSHWAREAHRRASGSTDCGQGGCDACR